MKIGIEEEFIVVDPETLWCTPGAFRLANGMVYRDFTYVRKCGVELPVHPRALGDLVKNIGTAFSVFEVKTDPYEDIDRLRDELVHHRKNVADVARDNHLMVLPTGLHPCYSSETFIPDNCAALHVHVDYDADVYGRLFERIPFLISISVNSPFVNGKPGAMSNRLNSSPHIGVPKDLYRRRSDLIHNTCLNTVEVRVLDSQVTVSDSLGLASLIKAIVELEAPSRGVTAEEYSLKREQAVLQRSTNGLIPHKEYEEIRNFNEYTKRFLEEKTGAEWQLNIFDNYNLSSVIISLWESFTAEKRRVVPSDKSIISDDTPFIDLFYFIPYFPFFAIDKYKKYRQDMMSISSFAKKKFFNH